MDPAATLLRIFGLIGAELWEEAQDALSDYITWREKGGFEPVWKSTSNIHETIQGDMLKNVLFLAICRGLHSKQGQPDERHGWDASDFDEHDSETRAGA